MKKFALVVAGLLAASAWSFAGAPPETKKYEPKNGAVTFNHKAHSAQYGAKCADCHHVGQPQACETCHNGQGKAPKLFAAFHGDGKFSCKTCHAKAVAAGKPAPKGCTDCHKK